MWPLCLPSPLTPPQSAVSCGRWLTTYWDPYLSIHRNAGTGRAKGAFFPPPLLPVFFWTAGIVLNHCNLQRAQTMLSHFLGRHFITRLYFLQIDTIYYTQYRAQSFHLEPWWEEQCWKLGTGHKLVPYNFPCRRFHRLPASALGNSGSGSNKSFGLGLQNMHDLCLPLWLSHCYQKPLSFIKCTAELIDCPGFIAKGQFTVQDNFK